MIILKFIVIAACSLHSFMHDKVTGYISFFAITIFWWAGTKEKDKKKKVKEVKTTFTIILNWLVALSIAAFVLTLIRFE